MVTRALPGAPTRTALNALVTTDIVCVSLCRPPVTRRIIPAWTEQTPFAFAQSILPREIRGSHWLWRIGVVMTVSGF